MRIKDGGIYAQMPRKGEDEGGGDLMHKCRVKVRMKDGGIYAQVPRKR